MCWDFLCGFGPVSSSPPVFRRSPPGVSDASGRMVALTELGYDLILWAALYVGVLLILGILGRKAKKEHTLSDHFLAGRSIGFVVLLLTLFATQYSGNSFSAFPGQTHRLGISYFMTVTFMVGVITGYTLFAPRLFSLWLSNRFSVIFFRACREELLHLCFPAGQVQVLPAG